MPGAAVFEVPEGAVTFESLGLSETYDGDTTKYQTKKVILNFAEPNEAKIVLVSFRRDRYFYTGIYVNGLLATEKFIERGNSETTMIIPGAFIKTGENTIYLEFIDYQEQNKFSSFPLTIAPKSYILYNHPQNGHTPTNTPTPAIIQMESIAFSITDIQKSSETSPEINIEVMKSKSDPNAIFLSGTASSDSGIESITVNGQYVSTENWIVPITVSSDNNYVIVVRDNEGNTTIQNFSLNSPYSEPENKNYLILPALISASATIIAAYIGYRAIKKKRHKK